MAAFLLYPEAENDLEGIWFYIVKNWGIEQAGKYIDDFNESFQFLAENPLICRERDEFTPSVHIHSHAHHLIIYLPSDEGIHIVRVLHESMDVEIKL